MHRPSQTVDVLVPTRDRPAALGITLACMLGQTWRDLRVVISDQSDEPIVERAELSAVTRVLEANGIEVRWHRNLPRRGMAHQRQFLLERATAPYVLFLDDDVITEPDLVERMVGALEENGCGFIGSAVLGPHYIGDVRPEQEAIELWEGRVEPERIRPGDPRWARASLHLAANLHHVAQRLGIGRGACRTYRVAWVGGCVLFDRAKLIESGGFEFWQDLPATHVGEDVLAQIRVMERFGGAGLIPSGAWHQDRIPTTHPDREHDAPWMLTGAELAASR